MFKKKTDTLFSIYVLGMLKYSARKLLERNKKSCATPIILVRAYKCLHRVEVYDRLCAIIVSLLGNSTQHNSYATENHFRIKAPRTWMDFLGPILAHFCI